MDCSDLRERHFDRIEICWRVTTASGHQFVCGLYRGGHQVEVRLTIGEQNLLYSRLLPTLDEARTLAHHWLRAVVAKGDFMAVGPPAKFPVATRH